MTRSFVHAPDGSKFYPGALCENRTGDCTATFDDVDCPECLDLLEELPEDAFPRFARCLEQFQQDLAKPSPRRHRQ